MTRQPLTAEQVYDECLAILDEEGLKGLNARHLTHRLACSTKTLYQLVGNRDAMVRGVVAHAFAGMDLEFRPGARLADEHQELVADAALGAAGPALPGQPDDPRGPRRHGRLRGAPGRRPGRARVPARFAVEVAGNVGHWTIGSTLLDLRAPGEWDQPERFEATLDWLVRGIDQVAGHP